MNQDQQPLKPLVYAKGREPKRILGNYQNVEVKRLDSIEIGPLVDPKEGDPRITVHGQFCVDEFLNVTAISLATMNTDDALDVVRQILKGVRQS